MQNAEIWGGGMFVFTDKPLLCGLPVTPLNVGDAALFYIAVGGTRGAPAFSERRKGVLLIRRDRSLALCAVRPCLPYAREFAVMPFHSFHELISRLGTR